MTLHTVCYISLKRIWVNSVFWYEFRFSDTFRNNQWSGWSIRIIISVFVLFVLQSCVCHTVFVWKLNYNLCDAAVCTVSAAVNICCVQYWTGWVAVKVTDCCCFSVTLKRRTAWRRPPSLSSCFFFFFSSCSLRNTTTSHDIYSLEDVWKSSAGVWTQRKPREEEELSLSYRKC